jgi:uncharacterized protein (PEP-CTERM system associated)
MTTTMAKRVRAKTTGHSPLFAPLAMLALALSPECQAAWKFSPKAELRETYTDNVSLAADELATSQLVSELSAGFTLANNGPRLKLLADYELHRYAYSDQPQAGTNQSQRQFRADAKARLVDDLLYFDGNASIGQQAISAFGPQPSGNGYASANRTEIKTYRVSPYLAHRFGAFASSELRYTRDAVDSGSVGLGNTRGDTVALNVASGEVFRTLGWGLQYTRQQLDDSIAQDSTSENALASLRYRISQGFSLTANGGYDKYDYQSLGGKTRGASWSTGFLWTPSLRTSIQASVGKRYFGSSKSLLATHRSRRTVWSVNYNDAVTTTRSQFLLPATIDTAALLDVLFTPTFPDPQARQQAVDAYMRATRLPASLADSINYLSNRFILQKQLQASAAFIGARSSLVLSVFDTRRTALSSQLADSALLGGSLVTLNDNTRQTGGNALATYRISPRSNVNLSATYSNTDSLSTGITDTNKALRLSLTRQFQPRLKGEIEVRRVHGTAATLNGRSYRENAVAASLSMQL